MRSIVAVTDEIDNVEHAVEDLARQVDAKGPLNKNSCGFVFCDVEIDHEPFIVALREKFPFEITGCTSIANFDTKNGARIMSVALAVLTANDAAFSTALTGALTPDNLREELKMAYHKAASALGEPGKLLLLIPPFDERVPLDAYVDTLSDASGGIPIFGGLPSSSMADDDIMMYAEGRARTDRAAITLAGGNIRPLFSVQNVLSGLSEQKSIVTKAEGNVIYTVEDKTFTDYLRTMGLSVDELIALGDPAVYVSTPLKIFTNMDEDNDAIPVARTIKKLNPKDGSGVLFGAIPEKSSVTVATMKRQDIQDSCKTAIKEIIKKIRAAEKEKKHYAYTTLLCVSCGGRYMVMVDDKNIEGDIIIGNLPAGMTLSGFYAYGEICPTAVRDGKAINRTHNESIVMCAI